MKKFSESLQKHIEQQEKLRQQLIEELTRRIDELPDNPNIERQGAGYTMTFSNLSGNLNLSARYYDFKFQYAAINNAIKEKPLEKLAPFLSKTIKEKLLKHRGEVIQLHDTVVNELSKIF